MVLPEHEEKKWLSLAKPKLLVKTVVGNVLSERFRCLRTGAEGDYISFELYDWVLVLAETPDKKLLIIRQFRHGRHRMEWEIPGGCIDAEDASAVAAGIRELREETGFEGDSAREIGCVCPNPALQSNRCHTVLIRNVRKTAPAALEDTEDIETYQLSLPEILDLIRSGKLDHGLMLNAVLFYLLEQENEQNEKRV